MREDLHIDHPDTIAFLTASRDFCRHIERPDWEGEDAFIVAVKKSLIRLYSYGLDLPLVELTKWYADTIELDESKLNICVQNIKGNTPFQFYWTILNPLEVEMPSTGTGDLIDDLHDIYKDIKLGLTYFDEVEGYKEFSLWTLKMTFKNHWSDHCISAIQIIHEYLSNKD